MASKLYYNHINVCFDFRFLSGHHVYLRFPPSCDHFHLFSKEKKPIFCSLSKMYLGPCYTSMVELFAKIITQKDSIILMFDRDLNQTLFFREDLPGYQFHHMVTDSLAKAKTVPWQTVYITQTQKNPLITNKSCLLMKLKQDHQVHKQQLFFSIIIPFPLKFLFDLKIHLNTKIQVETCKYQNQTWSVLVEQRLCLLLSLKESIKDNFLTKKTINLTCATSSCNIFIVAVRVQIF